MKKITNILSTFSPISLEEMDAVTLMNRSDTKFVFHQSVLMQILPKIKQYYHVLMINDIRLNQYRSLYYDTEEFSFYQEHHNGKANRSKVRFREYIDSKVCFLEVKQKNNKGKTIKKRTKVKEISEALNKEDYKFVEEVLGKEIQLKQSHWNSFSRATLVHKHQVERLTIDLKLEFYDDKSTGELENVVIAEVKQEKKSRASDFIRLIKEEGVHPFKISKYCIATSTLNKHLKNNRFKKKFLHLNKI